MAGEVGRLFKFRSRSGLPEITGWDFDARLSRGLQHNNILDFLSVWRIKRFPPRASWLEVLPSFRQRGYLL